jgi:Kef-type K+ transport system membrane component KefB
MWWLALAFTLGLMALLHLVARAGPLEARATLSLGFLLLVAHLGGELAKRARLPRLTGFLLTGVVVGPAWLGLVHADEIEALRFVGDGALALIAFAAGSELTLARLQGGRLMLLRAGAATVLFPLGLVTLAVLAVAPVFPLTAYQPFGDTVTAALVLGTIAAASSPAFTVAVLDELGARGPLARSLLDLTIVKDVGVMLLLTIVLAVGRPLSSAGSLDVAVAWSTLLRLGGSVLAGGALGYTVAAYLRIIRRDTPLFLIALAFFAVAVARFADLETMLIALAAGCTIANVAPPGGERLRADLKRGSLPVYIVFFALAGAGIPRRALEEFWVWAGLFAVARAVALRWGLTWAGRSPVVTRDLARHGWWGLISQAGVTLGLAAAARRAFPEWGVSLEALAVAMIAIHEVAGPLCLRHGLRLAGELSEGAHVTENAAAPGPAPVSGSSGV